MKPAQHLASGLNLLFPTLLWEANALSNPEVSGIGSACHRAFEDALRDAKRNDKQSRFLDYRGGYTTYNSGYPLIDDPRVQPLTDWILREADAFLASAGRAEDPRRRLHYASFFGTIGGQYSRHSMHRHEGCELSGVYYITAPRGAARLRLQSPQMALRGANKVQLFDAEGPWHQDDITVVPEEGKLLLFPSWLEHEVGVHRVKAERIAISVNLKFVLEG